MLGFDASGVIPDVGGWFSFVIVSCRLPFSEDVLEAEASSAELFNIDFCNELRDERRVVNSQEFDDVGACDEGVSRTSNVASALDVVSCCVVGFSRRVLPDTPAVLMEVDFSLEGCLCPRSSLH